MDNMPFSGLCGNGSAGGWIGCTWAGRRARAKLPWFWSWQDRAAAVRWAQSGRPFVQGPNMVFLWSRRPRVDRLECELLDRPECRLTFTESEWYRQLILAHRGPENRSPVVVWPYPIFPVPPGPVEPPEYNVLVYLKNDRFPGVAEAIWRRFDRVARSATAGIGGRSFGRRPDGPDAAAIWPTTIADRWPWPRSCCAAARRWGCRRGRRSSNRAATGYCSRTVGPKLGSAPPRGADGSIAARWPRRRECGSTRGRIVEVVVRAIEAARQG